MEGKVIKIEEKYSQLTEELKKQHLFLNEVNNALSRLKNDKTVTLSNIAKIEGAIQAYSESIRLMKEEKMVVSGEIV